MAPRNHYVFKALPFYGEALKKCAIGVAVAEGLHQAFILGITPFFAYALSGVMEWGL